MSPEVGGTVSSSRSASGNRGNGKRDGVADGFVEFVIGAILEKGRLIFVGALVEIVAEFGMDGVEIFAVGWIQTLMRIVPVVTSQALAWRRRHDRRAW